MPAELAWRRTAETDAQASKQAKTAEPRADGEPRSKLDPFALDWSVALEHE
jgi:hypothetical protein